VHTGYLKAFGLSEPAFGFAPAPRFFYVNRGSQERFLAVRYGIKLRSGVIVVTGEPGVGKTALMNMLKDRCDANTHIGEVTGSLHFGPRLLPALTRAVGMSQPNADQVTALRELRRYLIEQLVQDRIMAVVVEDAHELNVEALKELQLISKLRWDHKNLLQIVLVGRLSLEEHLQHAALATLKNRVGLWSKIEPLSRDEVGPYIHHRLKCAGSRRNEVFRVEAVRRISAYSGGIPGLINLLCERSLHAAAATSCAYVDAEHVDRVWRALQRSGEAQFEVAALLAEIRLNSQRADVRAPLNAPTKPDSFEQFGIDERTGGGAEVQIGRSVWSSLPRFRHVLGTQLRRANSALGRWQNMNGRVSIVLHWTRLNFASAAQFFADRSAGHRISRPGLSLLIILCAAAYLALNSERTTVSSSSDEKNPALAGDVRAPRQDLFTLDDQARSEGTNAPQLAAPDLAHYRGTGALAKSEPPPEIATRSEPARPAIPGLAAPVVYLHTSHPADLPVLEDVGDVLRLDGYQVREPRLSRNTTQGDIRFFFRGDRRAAERLKSRFQLELAKRGYSLSLQLLERDGRKFVHAAPGKIEVWLPPLPNMQRTG
jgi:type II secretory pathway predicted ATPase ExeA